MKSVFSLSAMALVSVVLFSASADAQQRRAPRANVLIGAELLVSVSEEGRTRAADGAVLIDVTGRQARILIKRTVSGRPANTNVTLPVTSVTRNACNVITYVAQRRTGTVLTTLTVRDKSDEADRCVQGRARVYTEVEFSTADSSSRDAAPKPAKFTAARLSSQGPNYIVSE